MTMPIGSVDLVEADETKPRVRTFSEPPPPRNTSSPTARAQGSQQAPSAAPHFSTLSEPTGLLTPAAIITVQHAFFLQSAFSSPAFSAAAAPSFPAELAASSELICSSSCCRTRLSGGIEEASRGQAPGFVCPPRTKPLYHSLGESGRRNVYHKLTSHRGVIPSVPEDRPFQHSLRPACGETEPENWAAL